MATNIDNNTLTALGLVSNVTQDDFTLVAQNIMCAYTISDIYAPTPRYLYYCLLFLAFATIRYRWLSNVFLGGAVAYAASAAIHAFIIVSSPSTVQSPANVTIPLVLPSSNLSSYVDSLVTGVTELVIRPDAVELDIDAIMAVVVTAYLVGLPLQIWSRTMRSSRIVHYMILLWNLCMLAGTICALVAWPLTNLAAPQYRFCYSGFLDSDFQSSDGWDDSYWKGSWNSTVWNIFNNPGTTWQELSNNCYYPCFNTSQVIRQSSALKGVVSTRSTSFAKLHNTQHGTHDEFQPLIYAAIIIFSVAQFLLYIVSALNLGSEAMREPIHKPHRLWRNKRKVWQQLAGDARCSWTMLKAMFRWPTRFSMRRSGKMENDEPQISVSNPQLDDVVYMFRLVVDVVALVTLIAGIALAPIVVVAFICWIEWYIRNDGSTNETPNQVGQWSPLVSLAVVLFAAILYQFKGHLASEEEVRMEIHRSELHIRKLKGQLEKKKAAMSTGETYQFD